MEVDEMIKFEIESGNPFSEYSSYKSYKANNKKKTTEKKKVKRRSYKVGRPSTKTT